MRALYILLPLLLAASAQAKDPLRANENPASICKEHSDCVVVEHGGCSGGWITVNKDHEAEYIKRATDMNSVIECARMPVFPPKPTAKCIKNACTLVEKK